MKTVCGCCAGIQGVTPESEANRPGLPAIAYRVGTHATFLESMIARLSSLYIDVPSIDGSGSVTRLYPLKQLTTRDPSDPSIALLDAWAVVADVLSFYEERIANEGYLPTATERRSILELARLIGYKLRPGVSASVYLAFTAANGFQGIIPQGTRSQSIPGTGETAQYFETSSDLAARETWNNLQPRLTRPQLISVGNANRVTQAQSLATLTDTNTQDILYFQGISTNLKVGDALLIVAGNDEGEQIIRFIASLDVRADQNLTQVTLTQAAPPASSAQPKQNADSGNAHTAVATTPLGGLTGILGRLATPPSVQPASSADLARTVTEAFSSGSDIAPRLLAAFQPAAASILYKAWENVKSAPTLGQVFAMRVKASLFGNNAPLQIQLDGKGNITGANDWPVADPPPDTENTPQIWHETPHFVYLNSGYDKILPNSWIVVQTTKTTLTKAQTLYAKAVNPTVLSRGDYGMSGNATMIELGSPGDPSDPSRDLSWITANETVNYSPVNTPPNDDFQAIRQTIVYAQPEALALAEVPVDRDVRGSTIVLDGVYDGLESGRWIIISGERTDIPNVTGVSGSELVMIAGVTQNLSNRYDTLHTTITLANSLAYTYKRTNVTIYGNVVNATHGQTIGEVLGDGDAGQPFDQFPLHQKPLTYVSAATPDGAQSTIVVRVNEIEWEEAGNLAALGPTDREYFTQTDDSDQTTVIFGNGVNGALLPTGTANVKATYRYGIGSPGNVQAGQISQLASHPLGVQGVINPLAASGGADRDTLEQGRRNAPLAVTALDRLVSTEDYAEFSRTYAGIGKAVATRISDGRRQLVHVTIAGAEDIPIDVNSDLHRNLVQSLLLYGDPNQALMVSVRKVKLLVISAGVQILVDYLWESVEPRIRAALLDTFGFDNRALGQSAFFSEAIAAMQRIEGVSYVDMQTFDAVAEDVTASQLAGLAGSLKRKNHVRAHLARLNPAFDPATNTDPTQRILPAEVVFLTPDIPDTLILNPIGGS